MTVPQGYWRASKDFEPFLQDVRDTCMLQTHNQAYHTLRAVLHVFRSHLGLAEALRFANVLPPVVRAIYVEDWDAAAAVTPFPSRDRLTWEVQHQRQDHNLAPDSAIADVAAAMWRHVDKADFARALAALPPGAADYWRV